MKFLQGFDFKILIPALVLCGFGAAAMSSVAPELFQSQIIFYIIGLVLFFVFSQIDYQIYKPLGPIIYVVSIILLVATLVIGLETRGSTRWIEIFSFRFQFSELLKPFLLISFASVLTSFDGRKISRIVLLMLYFAIPLFLVFKQPDLGSTIVYVGALAVMVFLSGISLLRLFVLSLMAVLVIPIGWLFLADYQRKRITSFLSPHYDPQGSSYNAIQSRISVGSGMFFGKGLGRGTQSHLSFLPEHHTDFVFATISEELGFIGSSFLIGTFAFLVWRIFTVAIKEENHFGRLLASGIGAMILVQSFINIGMNLGILPVTGVTLPLVSYGGSSILSTFIALGIAENISVRYNKGL